MSTDGKTRDLAIRPRLLVTTPEAAVDAAVGGAGLTQLYAYQGSEQVAAGALEIVLREFEIDPVPITVTIPAGRRVPQKVSAFVDFAMPHLRARVAAIAGQCER